LLYGLRLARTIDGEDHIEPENTLRQIVDESEREILTLGQQTGMDWYWRAYFWLVRR
jgi:hypothetical protein